MSQTSMSKGEREDLQRLVRQREKALKSAAKQRSTEMLAEFENHLAARYQFDQDETWAEAERLARAEVERSNARIAARCAELGIPKDFAPSLDFHWYGRGENASKVRRQELRKVAVSRIDAIEQAAIVQIELSSVQAQTEIATHGLTSQAARSFIERLPSVEELMKPLDFGAIAGDADPPVVEQMLSPNALRQKRYRDRQKTLRDANVTPALTTPHPETDGSGP